jgi:hypothetical protein
VNIGLHPEILADPIDGHEVQPQRLGDGREARALQRPGGGGAGSFMSAAML